MMLDSFDIWYLVTNITVFIGMLLLLSYYHGQKYWFAFAAGSLYFVSILIYTMVFYVILRFQKLTGYGALLLFLSLGSGVVYSLSLIFLRSPHTRWLKMAGVLMLVVGSTYLSSLIWGLTQPSFTTRSTIERISLWTSLASCLVPVLFMMHFISEGKRSRTDNWNAAPEKPLENWVGLAGIASSLLTLAFGLMIGSECFSSIYWSNWNYQKTKELAQLCDPGIFVNSKGETLHYRLLKPLDYDPTKKYPLVISLPYGGQPATDTIKQMEGAVIAELLTKGDNRRNYPAFIFIPNCPPGAGWGGIPNYPNVDSLVFDAIVALDRQFPIDDKRRYVAGLSRGGYGTWNFIGKRPDLFAAAIPVSGGGDPGLAAKAVTVAVWAFHGAKDRNVPVTYSRDMIDAIKRAGGDPKYTEYPEEGHNIWDRVSSTPGLLEWLFAQHR